MEVSGTMKEEMEISIFFILKHNILLNGHSQYKAFLAIHKFTSIQIGLRQTSKLSREKDEREED